MGFGKGFQGGFRENKDKQIKRRLYQFLIRDTTPSHCPAGHKHKTTNCRLSSGRLICRDCTAEE